MESQFVLLYLIQLIYEIFYQAKRAISFRLSVRHLVMSVCLFHDSYTIALNDCHDHMHECYLFLGSAMYVYGFIFFHFNHFKKIKWLLHRFFQYKSFPLNQYVAKTASRIEKKVIAFCG